MDVSQAQGPLVVEAALWYQPIGYRWAEYLRPYDAVETRLFVSCYTSMADSSGTIFDSDTVTIP